jgi:nucleoside-diphosphate-sugar epimerase
MQRLLIVGCGDVVRRVLPRLAKRWRIIALVRQRDPTLVALGVRQIVGDLDSPQTLCRLTGIADAVLHSAPPPASGSDDARTRNLLAVLARGSLPRALVYISTSGVYGDCAGAHVSETRPLAAESARAARRVAAETRLRQFAARHACQVSLLRAPGIYAEDRLPLERLHKHLPLLNAAEDSHTNHVHALDLGLACIAALRRGRPGRAYNISDDSALAMGDWFDLLADTFALPRAPRVSRAEAQTVLPAMQWSFMRESRRLDNTRMTRELKLRLTFPTVSGFLAAHRPTCSG